MTVPFVSIIVPCRNEVRYLGPCLDSILGSLFPRHRLEVLVADGMSTDGTRELAAEYARRYATVSVVENPRRITPTGLNRALAAARGDVIVRMDAHVVYPPEYVPRLVAALEETGADNVGGVVVTRPGGDTPVARAIAVALSHPFGVGNSYFRIGTSVRRQVDTVPFGCYRREVFNRVGPFDEEMVRGQDEELNHRLLRRGGRIVLLPDVVSYYYARASLRDVTRMYYQYGYYKPLVVRKVGAVLTVRQLVPAAFVATLCTAGALAPWSLLARAVFVTIAAAYAGAVAIAAAHTLPRLSPRAATWLLAVFPAMHVSYGVGFLRRVAELLLGPFRRATPAIDDSLSRSG